MNYIAKILLNSLYGRFGMDDNFPNINVMHKDYFRDFENKYLDNIIDHKEIGDYILVIYKNTIELEEVYKLQLTENKRNLIFRNNKLVATKAYNIDTNKKVL